MARKLHICFIIMVTPFLLSIYLIHMVCCGLVGFITSMKEYHANVMPEINKLVKFLKDN